MKQLLISIFLILIMHPLTFGQSPDQVLTLEECYDILYTENPMRDKIRMNRQITELNHRIAQSGWYPDVQVNASASYQSDVVEFPFDAPNFDIPAFSKDHYNIALQVTQPIYDGGRTRAAKELEEDSGLVTEASLESDLLDIKDHVDRIYFGILILQKQIEITKLVIDELSEQLEMIQSQVENGVLLPGNRASLQAEILRRKQELTELEFDLKGGYEGLGEFLGKEVDTSRSLELPQKTDWRKIGTQSLRPELLLISARHDLLDKQKNLIEADKLPVLSLFARPSYGRPGFNFFEDDLQFNWIVGVQARWSLKSTRNASLKSAAIDLQQKKLSEDRTLFERRQNAALFRLENQIESIEEQIERDREIVNLQKQVAGEKQSPKPG